MLNVAQIETFSVRDFDGLDASIGHGLGGNSLSERLLALTNKVNDVIGGLSAEIADPGDAGAIPVTQSGSVALVTGGAETRTLANPTFLGQQLALFLDTAGGNCVITVASGINVTGNTIITMDAARDYIRLEAVTVGGALRWEVVDNLNCVLS